MADLGDDAGAGDGVAGDGSARGGGLVDRLATALAGRTGSWRAPWWLPPVVLAWLLLSTIWGFGRAASPARATDFLVAGVLAGVVVGGGLLALRRPGRRGR